MMTPREALETVGVHVLDLQTISAPIGDLSIAEIGKQLPFLPRRYFVVYGVPDQTVRGQHAHRVQHQYLTCLHGSCRVHVENGRDHAEITLDSPRFGLHVPPRIWASQYDYSADAVLLVLSSDVYDESEYIRNYDEFLAMTGAK
jgi:dTDP-4-dehydrorhamnose 3,5-epimerase-like enzyme